MKKDVVKELKRISEFLQINLDEESIIEVAEYGSFENLRRLSLTHPLFLKKSSLAPKDSNDPRSFKFRKGIAGAYRDHLNEGDLAFIEHELRKYPLAAELYLNRNA